MLKKPLVDSNQYGFATGRIRALEGQLMDIARLNRLIEARNPEDIARVLADSGYASSDAPDVLDRETAELYKLAGEVMVNKEFVDALLVFNDCHNLKAIEKYLAAWWPRLSENPEDEYEKDPLARPDRLADLESPTLPEIELPATDDTANFSAISDLMVHPSLVEPELLFKAIRDRTPDSIPAWLYQGAIEAATAVRTRYDIAEIDQIIDRLAYTEAIHRAQELGNPFFLNYLFLRADLANLGSLLRSRLLKADQRTLSQTLLPAGKISHTMLLGWFVAEPEQITADLAQGPFAELAPFYSTPNQRGMLAAFGKACDHLILDHLKTTQYILRGPEVPLAYLLARLLEIKNVRIAQTLLRNKLPSAQIRELARDSLAARR